VTIRLHPQAEDDLSNTLNYYSAIDEALEAKFLNYLAIFNTKRDPENLMK